MDVKEIRVVTNCHWGFNHVFIEHGYSFLYHFKIIFSFLISYIVGFSYKKLFVYDEMYNQFS